MAKPRIFVSSTYYDLRHIRKGVELFISELGYDAILFENGDIPFSPDSPLDQSCYKEIGTSHILVLILGGRFGSQTSDSGVVLKDDELERHYQHYNSVTKRELETAINADIPVYIFVERGVSAEYLTYKENKENTQIRYAHVDSVNVFRLLEFIYSQKRNNLTKDFETLDDITSWLRDQWAGLLTEYLSNRKEERTLQSMQNQLNSLRNVAETLKTYSEDIIRKVVPENAESIIQLTESKQQENEIRDAFASHRLVRFLVKAYRLDVLTFMEIIRTAKDTKDLCRKAAVAFPEKQLLNFIRESFERKDMIDEFNSVRELLSAPPLEPLTKELIIAKDPRSARSELSHRRPIPKNKK